VPERSGSEEQEKEQMGRAVEEKIAMENPKSEIRSPKSTIKVLRIVL